MQTAIRLSLETSPNLDQYFADLALFHHQLAKENLAIFEIPGDGNCLFRALSFHLHGGDQSKHTQIRELFCEHFTANSHKWSEYIEDDMTVDQYVAKMSINGEWGGSLEIALLSEAL